ncbi:3-hydroxyacyl-CoA dehydrogenase NAD-binding domain-containing protein [Brevundimonas vesicularis]|uniref:3-hydroxyacyl-CoA dehydrogenase NAD-binding domain-containing protein n=1 Tax=Brevundimonas vesicularis TaxID=41276 RepID=UPI0038D45F6E
MSEALNPVVSYEVRDGIAVITVDAPPVNALSASVRQGIAGGMERATTDQSVKAIVLICSGRTFFAGADITEFGKPLVQPDLHAIQRQFEASDKLIVAAIHGTALGGGLELALTAHYRIAVPSARLGLPEVHLGLLPGAGGTQRLPRIVGPRAALDMMVSGKPIGAGAALKSGLIDRLAQGEDLKAEALAYVAELLFQGAPLKRIRDDEGRLSEARNNPDLFTQFRKDNARALKRFKAPENIIRAVEAAVSAPDLDAGLKAEWSLFEELVDSTESAAQRYFFFAERETARVPGLAPVKADAVRSVGVIGAGTMGGGIAMNFLNIGLPVTLVEQQQEALDRGVATIRRNYENTAAKGRMTQDEVERRMALLKPTLSFEDLSEPDLVIEAVYENLELKKTIFGRLDQVAKPSAVLASNTSFLDLDQIAEATKRPEQVLGLHFFSPANVMKLVEVIRGAGTAPEVVALGMAIGKAIVKTPVLSGVCDGFIANRMMAPRTEVAMSLILEGPMPWDIDRVLTEFGMPMGVFAMTDLVGVDVIGWDRENSSSSSVQEVLCEQGRWGQKRGAGFYDYDDRRRPTPSTHVEDIIRDFSQKAGITRAPIDDQDLLERLLFPVVNEGARILEEGIALRASDVDVALILGYGWPVWTGGPLFWADTVGLDRVVAGLKRLEARYGSAYAPSDLLVRLAESGGILHQQQGAA